MKVNHNKYRLFKYDSHPSNTFQLGDVVFKNSTDGPEIGVIIQTHSSVDFRTDMFGNCSLNEITFASEAQITELCPELLPDIDGTSKTISVTGQYVSLLELYNGDLRVSVTSKGIIELKDELKHRKNPSQCFSAIFEDIVEGTNFQYCTSAHYVLEHSPKLPIITTAHHLGPEGKWVRNADGNWWMHKGYGNFVRELILKGEVVFQLV